MNYFVSVCDACLLCIYAYVHKSINMVPYQNCRYVSGHVGARVHHCILLLLSVPLGSPMFMRPIDRPTLLTASRRGGILSLIRSRPLASSKLLIRCCGEKPRMAAEKKHATTRTHTYKTQTHTHKQTYMHTELIFNKTFIRILCIQTPGSVNIQSMD